MEWRRDGYSISTDRGRLDHEEIHAFLRESYWSPGIPREVVDRSIAGSLPFGLYVDVDVDADADADADADEGGRQVGFARVITDYATFAYLADVYVLPSHRGRGLARWMMQVIHAHPDLQGLRRWLLVTRDAQALYRRVGWRDIAMEDCSRFMEIVDREVYRRPARAPGADE